MTELVTIEVPDLGDFSEVEVIEILVEAGASVEPEETLLTLESDKASMDIPSPVAGVVKEVHVAMGDQVSTGTKIVSVEVTDQKSTPEPKKTTDESSTPEPKKTTDESSTPEPTKTTDESSTPEPQKATDKSSTPEPQKATDPQQRTNDQSSTPVADDKDSNGHDGHTLQAQVVVIGAGPGGYTAAFRAADLGLNVVLVERYKTLGGVCLNVGCIPSKALLHTAEVLQSVKAMSKHGVEFGEPSIDLPKLAGWKNTVVGKLTKGLSGLAKQRSVQVLTGRAEFTSANELLVHSDTKTETIRFEKAIIAAGSKAAEIPDFPNDDARLIDSTDALELEDVPNRLLIVGGGIIGLEMAAVYHALGSKITIVELMDGLIPGCDRDLVRPLHKRIEKLYENIFLETKVTGINTEDNGLLVKFEGEKAPSEDLFDKVLVAVGRQPNGLKIGADKAGVNVDDRGFIAVDPQQRTNVDHIFAIGDIVGQPMLAHKATHEAKVAAEVCAGHKAAFEPSAIPNVAYTDPEVAWTGLTESQCKEQNIAYDKGAFPWAASGRALGIGRDEGLTKVLFDKETQRVIGAGIVGPHAGDLIAEATLAIEMGTDVADLSLTIHPHPTLSETLNFAAEMVEGTITDLYLAKKK